MSGFKAFLLKTNALALAVGVVIGVAMGNVVTTLVNNVIMPPIGLVLGNVDFSEMKWVLKAASGSQKEVAIQYGLFINAVIAFIVVALVVYVIAMIFLRPAPEPPTKTCPFCKETVPADASKCKACASAI